MGIRLDDLVGNNNNNILEDKSKKTMNLLIIGIIIVVIIIAVIAFRMISSGNSKKIKEYTTNLLADATTLSQAVSQRYLNKLQGDESAIIGRELGNREDERKSINFGGQEIRFEKGYHYLTKDEALQLAPTLRINDLDYVVKYDTGEVINLKGVEYNGKTYYFQEDLLAINKILNGEEGAGFIPSDYTIFINTPEDMLKIAEHPDDIYKLCSNIDMSAYKGDQWPQISFSGYFDGRNYIISNFTVNRPSDEKVGLFSEIKSGAEVRNLYMDAVNVNGGKYTGAVAGVLNPDTVIKNVEVMSGTVSSTSDCVGGIFGQANGNITHAIARSDVSCGGINAGGFAGEITGGEYKQIAARKDKSEGRVKVTGTYNVGGFVGLINPLSETTIEECSAYADINAGTNNRGSVGMVGSDKSFDFNAGGFAGAVLPQKSAVNLTIDSAYARGKIERCDRNVGGFFGVVGVTGVPNLKFAHIYSAVDTNADCEDQESRGGFVGAVDLKGAGLTITGVYWRKENLINSDVNDSGIGRTISSGIGMTLHHETSDGLSIPSNFEGWDQDTLTKWRFFEARYGQKGSLPTLAWE